MSMWHRFAVSSDDDFECANAGCGAIVDERSLPRIALPCPVPPCGDESNSGSCVFVPAERGPECAYCGAPGCHRDEEDDDDEEVDLDLDADLDDHLSHE